MNNNLQKQFFKLTRLDSHNNGYLTRRTYRKRMRSYLEWASDRGLQKIQNIKNKAVIDYVNEQLDNGISIKTLQATLSAIRYYLRHTFCSFLSFSGTSDYVAKRLMGHSLNDSVTAGVYTHYNDDEILKAAKPYLDYVSDKLEKILEKPEAER